MEYYNQKGEKVAPDNLNELENTIPPISGWAFDMEVCSWELKDEFLRLWKQINPHPLYRTIKLNQK